MPSAVAAAADAKPAKPSDAKPADAKPPKKPRAPLTKKRLLAFIVGGVLLLAAIGGGGFVVLMKKRAAASQLDGTDAEHAVAHGSAPIYVPLDVFTVNLADNDAERFAQVGVTFEVEDDKAIEQVKSYLPSIRNAILLILTRKTSAGLLGAEGKEQLAREIARGAARAMGYDVPPADAASASARLESFGPIRHVHFANFIIQ